MINIFDFANSQIRKNEINGLDGLVLGGGGSNPYKTLFPPHVRLKQTNLHRPNPLPFRDPRPRLPPTLQNLRFFPSLTPSLLKSCGNFFCGGGGEEG